MTLYGVVVRYHWEHNMTNKHKWKYWAEELLSIARAGLTYSKDPFDVERFKRIHEMSAEILAHGSDQSFEKIMDILNQEEYYLTPKIDVRVACIVNNQILLVQEHKDQKWSLPGGWADINLSPSENAIKEVKEETGFDVKITKLYGFIDKHKHNYPPQIPHAYKCLFLGNIIGGTLSTSLETTAVQFFDPDKLPPLSLHRIMPEQIALAYEYHKNPNLETTYD